MEQDVIKRARELLTPALVFHTEITVRRAYGIYVDGTDGKRYMDFSSGLATVNLGHCPERVVEAVKRQIDEIIHSGCIFYYPSIVGLAERLRRITPDGIDMFFFSNSGAEAVEGAVKLARYTTGRQGVIAFTGSFHGRTMGSISLTTSTSKYRKGYHPLLPSVFHAPYPYCYRCPMGQTRDECSMECFKYLERMLRHIISPEEVACIVIEPVLGEGGYVVPPEDYLVNLRRLCTEHGILFIADEVQTGFGRTGTWFACEHFRIKPDIITVAKAIAGGFPLSAVGASEEIMKGWSPGAHGTTFGGNPVSCAAACASIDTIEEEQLLENVQKVGRYAIERLMSLKKDHPFIGDVRGLGFMIGVEFVKEDGSPNPELLNTVIERCLEKGLILVECGREKNIIRFMPPLIAKHTDMERALNIFEEALG